MKKHAIWFLTAGTLLLLIALALPARAGMLAPDAQRAKQASAAEIVGDLVIIRPITLGFTFLGAGALSLATACQCTSAACKLLRA